MSHRLEKINELIKQELAKIIFKEEEFGPGVLVTLMGVKTFQDLRDCVCTISVLPDEKSKQVLKTIDNHLWHLQQLLNKKIKMHPVPKIHFVLDSSESESQKIDMLLAKIKKEEL